MFFQNIFFIFFQFKYIYINNIYFSLTNISLKVSTKFKDVFKIVIVMAI